MPNSRLPGKRGDVRRLAYLLCASQVSDTQLLEMYVAQGDEAAFEVLVRRYGPLVFGACHRVLRHVQDSEDAFQATFLVLARRAAAIRRDSSLANWLYGVARRTALHARGKIARRRREESLATSPTTEDAADARADLEALIDKELQRLPAKYREPVILCDMLGHTKRQAARELGCPEGTVSSRLARGRELLRQRLGAKLPGFTSLGSLLVPPAPGVIPAAAKAAGLLAKGGLAATVPYVLMKGVLNSMWYTRITMLAAVTLSLLTLGGGGVMIARAPGQGEPLVSQDKNEGSSKGLVANPFKDQPVMAQDKKEPPSKTPVADLATDSNVKREDLRYDGEGFPWWKSVIDTELKPAKIAPAVDAIAAFAASGYEAESIPILITAVNRLDATTPTRDSAEEHIFDTTEAALKKIGPKVLPQLGKELENLNVNHRRWGARLLFVMAPQYREATRPLLFQGLKNSDSWVHSWALAGLTCNSDLSASILADQLPAMADSEKRELLRELTKSFLSRDPEPVQFLTMESWKRSERWIANQAKMGLTPPGGGVGGFSGIQGPSQTWRISLMAMGREAKNAFSELVKGLKSDGLQAQTIAVLVEMGPDVAKSVLPDMIKALNRDDPDIHLAIIALGKMGPAAKDAVPALRALYRPSVITKRGLNIGQFLDDALEKIEPE